MRLCPDIGEQNHQIVRLYVQEHGEKEPGCGRTVAITQREGPGYSFTLDDLGELMGYVAAEANHAKDKKLQKELDRLFERMQKVLESYTDEDDRSTD
jgi:hypothetical protein